eukprot:TRINITY_DN11259_c0_g1_i4.p1 TRINITY_DN11259_c0_g1~~TRINITY_DN11259_c0_g1_i4.p1  ORF type:complete len:1385 (+),score=350.34 TRINITY_DN11259_c0_g1_i4:48-4202(+)
MSKKGGKRPKSTGATDPVIEETAPLYYPFFSKADIANEKWGEVKGSKEKQTWPYEDPCDDVYLPPSLHKPSLDVKRPSELVSEADAAKLCVVDGQRFVKTAVATITGETDQHYLRKKQLKLAPRTEEPWVSLSYCNNHLMMSPLLRELIAAMSLLQREPDKNLPHSVRPWQLIYPQDANGQPEYNPSGKYAVKLYWMGAWRKVLIDDRIPVVDNDQWQLPRTPYTGELWLTLITKAILKLAALAYDARPGSPEACDFDVLTALTGWISEQCKLADNAPARLQQLHQLCKPQSLGLELVQDRPASSTNGDCPADSTSTSKTSLDPNKERVRKTNASRVGSARGPSRQTSARRRGSTFSQETTGDAPVIARPESGLKLVTAGFKTVPKLGLDPRVHHHVRVLECVPITPNVRPQAPLQWDNLDDWVVVVESPTFRWQGALSQQDTDAWTPTIQAALGTSKDQIVRYYKAMSAAHNNQTDHAPFKSYIKGRDFFAFFRTMQVYHKPLAQGHSVLLQQLGASELVAKQSLGQHGRAFTTDFDTMDRQSKTPFYLTVDSQSDIVLFVRLSVTPTQPPARIQQQLASQPAEGIEPELAEGSDATQERETSPPAPGVVYEAPQYGSVLLQELDPYERYLDAPPTAILRTASSTGTILKLPPGRYIYRLNTHAPNGVAVSVYSDKEVDILSQTQAFALLLQPCARLQQTAADLGQLINGLMGGDLTKASTLEEHQQATDAALQALQATLSKLKASHDLTTAHLGHAREALEWTVREALGDKWDAVANNWQQMFDRMARWAKQSYRHRPQSQATANDPSDASVSTDQPSEPTVSTTNNATNSSSAGAEDANDPKPAEQVDAISVQAKDADAVPANVVNTGDDESDPDPEAVTMIQASVRGFLTRKHLDQQDQEDVKRLREALSSSWSALKINMLDFGVMALRRYFELTPSMLRTSPFAREEQHLAMLQDVSGSIESGPAWTWTAFYSTDFTVGEPVHALLQLQVDQTSMSARLKDQPTVVLHLYDHKAKLHLTDVKGPILHQLQPSDAGYTLTAAYTSPEPLDSLAWRVRCLSYPRFPALPEAASPEHSKTASGPLEVDADLLFQYKCTPSISNQLLHVAAQLEGLGTELAQVEMTIANSQGVELDRSCGTMVASLPCLASLLAVADNAAEPDFLVISARATGITDKMREMTAADKGRVKSGKSRGRSAKPSGPGWRLTVSSSATLQLDEDLRRQHAMESEVRGWEAAEAGRQQKAKAARDKHWASGEGSVEHLTPRKPEYRKPIVNEATTAADEAAKIQLIRRYKACRELQLEQAQIEAEQRAETAKQHIIAFAKHRATGHERMINANKLRTAYQSKLQAAIDAKLQAEQAAQQQAEAEAAGKDKGKKGKKK